MDFYEIEFSDVGRTKKCWTERLNQKPNDSIVARLVDKRGVLISHNVWCSDGCVFAGIHTVGRYAIREVSCITNPFAFYVRYVIVPGWNTSWHALPSHAAAARSRALHRVRKLWPPAPTFVFGPRGPVI